MEHAMSYRHSLLVLVVFVLFFVVVGTTPALAGEQDAYKEIELRIKVLLSEAEMLKKAGKHDAADILRQRADAWRRELRQDRRRKQPMSLEQAERVLHGLEMGMEALAALERHEELEMLKRIANGLRERMQRARKARELAQREEREAAQKARRKAEGAAMRARRKAEGEHSERDIARRRLEIMRVAFKALMEGEKREAAELMEHAIHALELGLAGRRDEEAQKIRRSAPKVGAQAEILALASRLYAKWGHEKEAKIVGGLAEELGRIARRARAREKEPGGKREHARERERNTERDIVRRRLGLFRHAATAFREAQRPDLVGHMEKAIRAYEVALEGRRDDEAHAIRKQAPSKENLAELLGYAGHLWAEWGHEEKAAALKQLSRELLGRGEKRKSREHERREEHGAEEELSKLRRQIRELMEKTSRLRKELEGLGGSER